MWGRLKEEKRDKEGREATGDGATGRSVRVLQLSNVGRLQK